MNALDLMQQYSYRILDTVPATGTICYSTSLQERLLQYYLQPLDPSIRLGSNGSGAKLGHCGSLTW
jgi:hypothetical protein